MTHVNPDDYQHWTYIKYRKMITELMEQAGKTTGPNQSEYYLEVTQLNLSRMKRLDRKSRLAEETVGFLAEIKRPIRLLTISESWCGDAAQTLPIVNWMVEKSDNLELLVVLRDDNPTLMDAFLTNGGRSIPKVILLDPETNGVLGDWGPRPFPAQQMVTDYLALPDPKPAYTEFQKQLHSWYAKDKGRTTELEVVEVLRSVMNRKG